MAGTMSSLPALSVLLLVVVPLALFEFRRHQLHLQSIPIRIHVNGTRGKSSVTRLIGAGLRAGGIATITKVTGTFPRLILEDGEEIEVPRRAGANILEQLSIVDFAAARQTRALVIECMALQPEYQRVTEQQMIRATAGVMTNVRLDHCDVMGYTLEEIATSMGGTIPEDGLMFTAEDTMLPTLRRLSTAMRTRLRPTHGETVLAEEMLGFRYLEHRDNVALALAVCQHHGVDRQTALAGMHQAPYDAGALTVCQTERGGKAISFWNAFAANDPDSTLRIWRELEETGRFEEQRLILVNTRADRADRSRQLAELVAGPLRDAADLVVMGDATQDIVRPALSQGFPSVRLYDLGNAESSEIFDHLFAMTAECCSVVAMGNMGGHGADTANLFAERSLEHHG